MSKANKPTPSSLYENGRSFEAYHFGFTPTNCYVADVILHAVAKAGKSFHHTEFWGEATEPYTDHLSGQSPVDWIEQAANKAAERITHLEMRNAELLEALRQAKAEGELKVVDVAQLQARVAELEDALRAVETLFGLLARDSTKKTWLDKAQELLRA